MKLLFIIDRIDQLAFSRDSSLFMMKESLERGCSVYFCLTDGISLIHYNIMIRCFKVDGFEKKNIASHECVMSIDDFSRILVRKEPPFDRHYLYLTLLLQHAQRTKYVTVYNDPAHLQQINEKLFIFQFPHDITPSIVSSEKSTLFNFLNQHKTVVAKKLDGMGGNAVFRVAHDDDNHFLLLSLLSANYTEKIMMQKFIPEIHETGDMRVLLIHGEIIPFGLRRFPAPTDFRANIAAGGYGSVTPLSAKEKEIAEKVAHFFRNDPVALIGLDIFNSQLNEINVTCPSCIKQIEEGTNNEFNLVEKFIRLNTSQ